MKVRGLLAGTLAALLATTCGGDGGTVEPAPPPIPTGTVVGQVTVEGTPLQGVLVSLSGATRQSTATGADGGFQFVSVPAGSHTVTLTSGIPSDVVFSRTTAQVTISSAGDQARADFPGEYLRTASIRGAVLALTQGSQPRPVEGVALRMSGLQEAADTTDAGGRYEFVALRAGEYTVSLQSTEGFAFDATSFTATLSSGQVLQRDFVGAKDLFIATDSLGIGRVAVPYSQQLVARGGTIEGLVWSLAAGRLPAGLVFESSGRIHGTPRSAGVSEFGVTVVDPEMKRATATLSLRVCEGVIDLETGEYEVYDRDSLMPCGLFVQAPQAGAYYRVTMVETDVAARRVHGVELSVDGTPASPSAAVVASSTRPQGRPRQEATTVAGPWLDELLEKERAYARSHARLRRSEAELMQRLGAEGPLPILPDLSHQVARSAASGAGRKTAPEEYEFRLGNPFEGGSCQVDTTVTARLVAENDYLAFYEYQTTVSTDNVRQILDYYAQYGEEVIQRYFGGVSDVNGDGLVNVLIRPDLPGNNRAYVWSADMTLSQGNCPASNRMELIHVDAESIDDISGNDYWVLGTIVHEMKHVSSLYKRFRRRDSGSPFHPLWIEEGTADIAKEVSSRLAWQRAGGPTTTDRVTGEMLVSAVRATGGSARREAFGVFTAMARVVWAFSPDSSAVTFEHTRSDGTPEGDIYGSGWHLHRFLRDWVVEGATSTAADANFMRMLNDSLTVAGVSGIVAVTGTPIDELLTEHAIAMTFAGSEDVAGRDVPRFATYDYPTAAEVFSQPDPPGFYPWPVTTTGEDTDDEFAPVAVPLATPGTRAFSGGLASSGQRFHDFRARASGDAAAFYFDIPGSARVIVARIADPNPGR